jgi:hypothetical protein
MFHAYANRNMRVEQDKSDLDGFDLNHDEGVTFDLFTDRETE